MNRLNFLWYDWLLSLSITFEVSSVLGYVSVLHFFLLLNNTPPYVYATFYLPIHEGGLHFLSVMNNTSMNIRKQVFMCMYVFTFLGCILGNGAAGFYIAF